MGVYRAARATLVQSGFIAGKLLVAEDRRGGGACLNHELITEMSTSYFNGKCHCGRNPWMWKRYVSSTIIFVIVSALLIHPKRNQSVAN